MQVCHEPLLSVTITEMLFWKVLVPSWAGQVDAGPGVREMDLTAEAVHPYLGLAFGLSGHPSVRLATLTCIWPVFLSNGRDAPLKDEGKEIWRDADSEVMPSRKPWMSRRWYKGDVYALLFLLLGLVDILIVLTTEGEYATWALWIAVPMVMFSLAYIFLVSALPIFLGPRSKDSPPEETPREED